MCASRQQGASVALKAFDKHFAIVPEIPTVVYKIITDPSTVSIAVETGDIHLAGYSSSVPASNIPMLEQNEKLNVAFYDSITTNYMTFNSEIEPFNNVALRQAVAYACDSQFMVDAVEEGRGTVAKAMTNSQIFGHPSKLEGYPYDLEKAKAKMEEAGYPGGAGLPALQLKVMEGKQAKAAEIVLNGMQQIGFNIEIQIMEKNAYLAEVLAGNYQVAFLGITLGDDAAVYSLIYTSHNVNGLNTARVQDSKIDTLFNEGGVISDPAARIEKYAEVFKIVEDGCYYAPLYFPQIAIISSKDIVMGDFYGTVFLLYEITNAK